MVGNSPNYSIMPHFTTQSQRQPRFLVWHSLRKTDSIKREHLWLLSSKKFSKMSLSVGSTWRSASFCFISFGVHNVTQRGIMEKGNLKAPPQQQDGQAMLFCSAGTLTLFACQWLKRCILNSAELKERSQHMFFFFFLFQSTSSPLFACFRSQFPLGLCFIFHGFSG